MSADLSGKNPANKSTFAVIKSLNVRKVWHCFSKISTFVAESNSQNVIILYQELFKILGEAAKKLFPHLWPGL